MAQGARFRHAGSLTIQAKRRDAAIYPHLVAGHGTPAIQQLPLELDGRGANVHGARPGGLAWKPPRREHVQQRRRGRRLRFRRCRRCCLLLPLGASGDLRLQRAVVRGGRMSAGCSRGPVRCRRVPAHRPVEADGHGRVLRPRPGTTAARGLDERPCGEVLAAPTARSAHRLLDAHGDLRGARDAPAAAGARRGR